MLLSLLPLDGESVVTVPKDDKQTSDGEEGVELAVVGECESVLLPVVAAANKGFCWESGGDEI